jgi:malonyl CoA-acyl carrier protein transacylase
MSYEHALPPRGSSRRADSEAVEAEPVLLLAGADAEDLLGQVESLDADDVTLGSHPHPQPAPDGGPARLGIVGVDRQRLRLAANVLDRGTALRGRNGVWFDPAGALREGRLALIHPGVEPGVPPSLAEVATHFGLDDIGSETADDAGATTDDGLSPRVQGMLATGGLLTRALARIGVVPDEVAGHGLGEWTAQVATSMVTAADIARLSTERLPDGVSGPDAVFVAVGAGAATAAEIVAGLPSAYVSHDNSPHHSVVCASGPDVPVVTDRARHRHVMARPLPYGSGRHSPLFAPVAERVAERIATIEFRSAVPRLWSATSVSPYPDDPEQIRALCVRHLVERVRFRELVERLHAEGVRGFVQVGSGSLTGFVDDTLQGADVVSIAAQSERRTGMEQLRHVAVALWSAGREVDLDAFGPGALLAPRPVRSPGEPRR